MIDQLEEFGFVNAGQFRLDGETLRFEQIHEGDNPANIIYAIITNHQNLYVGERIFLHNIISDLTVGNIHHITHHNNHNLIRDRINEDEVYLFYISQAVTTKQLVVQAFPIH